MPQRVGALARLLSLLFLTLHFTAMAVAQDKFPFQSFLQGKPIASDDLEYSIRLGGRLHADMNVYDGVFNNSDGGGSEQETFIRRGRLNISGYASSNWQYRLQAVLEKDADNDVSDAFVIYKGFGPKFWVRIGKQKEDLGLEWVTSSNTTTAIERSAATRAFSNIRSEGISLMGRHEDLSYNFGVHNNDYTDDNKPVLTARIVKKNINEKREVFQFGGGFSFREGDRREIVVRPEIREISRVNRVSSGQFQSDDGWVFNLETMKIKDNWHLSAELYLSEYSGDKDLSSNGGYITAGYFITGEKRLYDDLFGRFSGVTPIKESGAWEVFTRYSWIDLADNGQGNSADILTIGTNWYVNSRIRLMLDYVHTEYDKAPDALSETGVAVIGKTSGDAVAARFQFWY